MKNLSIQFALLAITVLTLSVMSQARAEQVFKLSVFKNGALAFTAVYSKLPDCLVDGMKYKAEGYEFECGAVQ